MPTIITRGLGYDTPTIIYRDIASELVGSVVAEERIVGVITVEESPVGKISSLSIPIFGLVIAETEVRGVVAESQLVIGVVQEEGSLMSLETNRVDMFIGDDRTLSLSVTRKRVDGTQGPEDITDAKIWMTVKERTSDTDANALIKKKNAAAGGSDAEIKIIDAAGGKAEIYLVPDDSDQLNPGTYIYDVQVILANGKTYTITRDKITFKEDVTKVAG